jgi:hypothetical protein
MNLVSAAIVLLAIGPAWAAEPVTLDQIMAALRSVRHVDARYVERRYLHILKTPIEARGELHFDAPGRLVKQADPLPTGPVGMAGERVVMDGDKLTIDRGRVGPLVIDLNEHPEIAALSTSLRATLAGDGAALQRVFEVTASGRADHWMMVLQPRDPAVRTLLQWVRVTGYGARITGIDTANAEGDRSEMSIVEQGR